MANIIALVINLIPLWFLIIAYLVGKYAEKKHYRMIHEREKIFLNKPAVTIKTVDHPESIHHSELAIGAVVVSVDHFKRFLMSFRRIFGGEVRSYASLIDRGRREAILRMKESCPTADMFLNTRVETSTISNGKGKATGCVEVVAYSTAVMLNT